MKSLVPLLLIGLASASSVHAQCNYLAAKTRTCSDGKNFAESFIPDPLNPGSKTTVVCNLDKYDPSNFTATKAAGYQPPRCKGAAADVNPAYLKLIESAYDIAPPAVKRNLCKLTHVFVITAGSYPVGTPLEALGRWGKLRPRGQRHEHVHSHTLRHARRGIGPGFPRSRGECPIVQASERVATPQKFAVVHGRSTVERFEGGDPSGSRS